MSKVIILKSGLIEKFEVEEVIEEIISLEYLQEKVGGYIEIPYISKKLCEKGIDAIINEEGKLKGLEPTIAIVVEEEVVDVVVGTVVFCGHDDEGNSIGLNDLQVKFMEKAFEEDINILNENKDKCWAVKVLNIE